MASSRSDAAAAIPGAARELFLDTGDFRAVLRERTARVDRAVTQAFADFLAPAGSGGIAVAAVGGYGRRELFPHSDIDLLILLEREDEAALSGLSCFLRELWDVGLRLSHSVRRVRECLELDGGNIELAASLLDRRHVAGDPGLYGALAERLPAFVSGQRHALARHLCRLTRERHARFQNTIYHLEPQVKEGPGGLRDLHLLAWLARVEGREATEPETAAAGEFLGALRCFLHFRAGRDSNVLMFDAQEELAALPFAPPGGPAEAMRAYFRQARAVHRAVLAAMDRVESRSSALVAGFRQWRSRLSNADFTVLGERAYIKAPHRLQAEPWLALRLFQFVARHGIPLHPDAEQRIRAQRGAIAGWLAHPGPLWPALRELLTQPHAGLALRAMHETGFLGLLFPEWEAVDCLAIRDFHHRYTVDEHTLLAIEAIDALAAADAPAERRLAALVEETGGGALLRLALLFHDVGKAAGPGPHCEASAQAAAGAALRVQVPAAERRSLQVLIESHLALAAAVSGRDLDDPQTARDLAAQVGTVENLKNLVLLTYADISAVHPGAMSGWWLDQLWRTYVATYNELTRELESERIARPAGGPERAAFLEGLPTRYLRAWPEEEIERHVGMDAVRRTEGAAVEVEKLGDVYRATVVTGDRPLLFASLAGALACFGMNIVKAEAFANREGTVIDGFVFADPARTLELNPGEADRLRSVLRRVAVGKLGIKELLQYRPTPRRPGRKSRIEPRVAFDNGASASATLVEIVAEDRPGLLYDLASRFAGAGCEIVVVLIDTQAHKAIDVFYVARGGRKLEESDQARLREELVAACGG